MYKVFVFTLLFLSIILTGCQSQTNVNVSSNDELYNDAKVIYEEIKNGEHNVHDKIDEFSTTYIDNIDDYESQRDLLIEMDGLSWSYIMYYVSIGQEDKEAIEFHKDNINESLTVLEKEFN